MKNHWLQVSPFSKLPKHKDVHHILGIGVPHWKSHTTAFNYQILFRTTINLDECMVNAFTKIAGAVGRRHNHSINWAITHPDLVKFVPFSKTAHNKSDGVRTYVGSLLSNHCTLFTDDSFPEHLILMGGGTEIKKTLGYYGGIEIQ